MATITHTHVLAMARNLTTGQTVKEQDLTGHRYLNNLRGKDWCQQAADKLAARMDNRVPGGWEARIVPYTPGKNVLNSTRRFKTK